MEASAFERPMHVPRHRPRRLRRSDAALAARVGTGDERAFEELYDRFAGPLLGFCRHLVGAQDEAEDVLQHTFMAAHRALSRGERPEHVKAWLYTIARNRSLSVLRARRDELALDEEGSPAISTRGLAAEVEERSDLRELVGDLGRLPEEQRTALVLFELGDHSQDDIAAVLDVRREKVKALVFQARETLIGYRAARETPCAEVREQLSTLRGSALRRAPLRRHVEVCAGCREFDEQVRRQRAALAVVLPVVPAAGLKSAVLSSALGGSAASAAGTTAAATATASAPAAGGFAIAGKGIAAKALVALAVAGGAGGAGYVAVEQVTPSSPPSPPAQRSTPARPAAAHRPAAAAPAKATPASTTPAAAKRAKRAHAKRARSASSPTPSASSRGNHTGVGKAKGTPATPAKATPTRAHGTSGAPGRLKARPKPAIRPKAAKGKAHQQQVAKAVATPPSTAAATTPATGKPTASTPPGQAAKAVDDVAAGAAKAVGTGKAQK